MQPGLTSCASGMLKKRAKSLKTPVRDVRKLFHSSREARIARRGSIFVKQAAGLLPRRQHSLPVFS